MKFIRKGQEPPELAAWKALSNDNWKPNYDALRGEEKAAVLEALMREQGSICCYCERRLTEGDRHIEHLVPQCDGSVDGLDFSNLLCSCQDRLCPGEPRHCGNLKGEWHDPDLLVSPLDSGCEARFAFLGNGEIRPAHDGDEGAKTTIRRLGLGIPKLNSMRMGAIEPFLDEALTEADLLKFVEQYLLPDPNGDYSPFHTTIQSLFDR